MVDPFTAISRFLFDQALRLDPGRSESRDPDWPPGARLQALVRAVAEPSRALLQIGDHLVDARLPALPKPGERLTLRVVEPFPKLVFSLEADDVPVAAGRTEVHLSTAARILGDVVGRQIEQSGRRALPLAQTQPLPEPIPDGPPHGEAIARHLQQSLEKSGLFYERHQARWVAGEYPLADLRQEPQAQRTPSANAAAAQAAAQPPAAQIEGDPVVTTVSVLPREGAEVRGGVDARSQSEPPLRGQIELLDGRGLTVSLPSWSGRDIQWQLPEREPQADGSPEAAWTTQLAVTLPSLGSVRAQLRISGNSLALAVHTDTEDSSRRLSAAQADLMRNLHDAGLSLTQMTIAAEDGTEPSSAR